jgi:hypothetical protein
MTFLPLVERELRLAARRSGTFWTRFWAAAIFIGISLSMIMGSKLPAPQLATMMSAVLGFLAFGYSLLAGVRHTSDCVSEERREGTLGFLFLTDLRGYDVVLGKLAVTSLNALYGLLAIFPALGLPLLLGGITGSEFWRLSLLLVNTLFFSLALGMLVSVLGRDERQTMLGTLFALIGVTFGLPVLWKGAVMLVDSRWWDICLLLPSPGYAFKIYSSGRRDFWLSMLTIFTLGAGFIVASSFLLPRVFQENRSQRTQQWADRWQRWRFGNGSRSPDSHDTRFGMNPFAWLLRRDRLPKFFLWIFVLAAIGSGVWTYSVISNRRTTLIPVAIFGYFGFHVLLKFLIAAEACRRVNEEKRTGTLELLLSTRLTMSDIASAQMSGLRLRFGPAILVLMTLNLNWSMWVTSINDPILRTMAFGGLIILPLDFLALSWVGMALALRGRPYHRTVLATFGRVMLPAWAAMFLFLVTTMGGGISSSELTTFFVFWFAAAGIYDWRLTAWAKTSIALEYPPPPPWLGTARNVYPKPPVLIPSKY